jgi:hypothetical protein
MEIRYEICDEGDHYAEKTQTPLDPGSLADLLESQIPTSDIVKSSWGAGEFSKTLPNGGRLVFLAWTGGPRLIYVRPPKKK